MALYRAVGHVLLVLPARVPDRTREAAMLSPRERHRDWMRPERPAVPRPYAPPDPGPPPALFDPGPVDHAFEWLMRLGRWKRVGSWWIFPSDQLEEILSCN